MKISRIKSSGLEGAESAALKAAKKNNISIGGWTPKGSDSSSEFLTETQSASKEQSTIWNVRDSHATVIIGAVGKILTTNLAFETAESYQRPVIVSDDPNEIIAWLNKLGEELTINIVGPNEHEVEGVERAAFKLLNAVFSHFNKNFY